MAINWERAYVKEREIAEIMCKTKKLRKSLDMIDKANLSFKQKFLQTLQFEEEIDQAFYDRFENECLDAFTKKMDTYSKEECEMLKRVEQRLVNAFAT